MSKPQPQPQKMPPVQPAEQKPALTDAVLVTTREAIGGQKEHAAIVTKVISDDVVNVMVLPSAGQPYPIEAVARTGALCWRYPPPRPRG
jgi:hypothetical protein